jgi:hypothetical protein
MSQRAKDIAGTVTPDRWMAEILYLDGTTRVIAFEERRLAVAPIERLGRQSRFRPRSRLLVLPRSADTGAGRGGSPRVTRLLLVLG